MAATASPEPMTDARLDGIRRALERQQVFDMTTGVWFHRAAGDLVAEVEQLRAEMQRRRTLEEVLAVVNEVLGASTSTGGRALGRLLVPAIRRLYGERS